MTDENNITDKLDLSKDVINAVDTVDTIDAVDTIDEVNDYDESDDLSIPLDVHIGFYSNITMKEVKRHILAYSERNFTSLNDVYYQIKKFEDGFLFEIHQGGDTAGYLSDYIDNHYEDALIVTSGNIYRATPSVHGGIRLVKLTDDDVKEVSSNPDNFDILEGRDKLVKLKSTGYGFFLFTTIMFSLSVLSVGISASVKYLVLDKTEVIYFTNVDKTYPHEFIDDIQNEMYRMDLSAEFFKNFTYDASKPSGERWKVGKGSILAEGSMHQEEFQDNSQQTEKIEDGN